MESKAQLEYMQTLVEGRNVGLYHMSYPISTLVMRAVLTKAENNKVTKL